VSPALRRPERPSSWPSAATTLAGVIGDPIGESLSPLLHNTAYAALGVDWVSLAFPVAEGHAGAAMAGMRALRLAGLSVTMPHKAAVIGHLDELDAVADRLGAVNCVRRDGERLIGHNTDGEGFVASLRRGVGLDPAGCSCAVLGAGGAARAVVLALSEAGARSVTVINRRPDAALRAAALAGPKGAVGRPEDARVTPWLLDAQARGATVLGGLGMLVHQAAAALARWLGQEVPVEAMWEAAARATGAGAEGPGAARAGGQPTL
jgi:shikimate dehydrogenase